MRVQVLFGTAIFAAFAYTCGGVDADDALLNGDAGGDDDDGDSTHDASVRDSGIHDASFSDGGIVVADSGHEWTPATTAASSRIRITMAAVS